MQATFTGYKTKSDAKRGFGRKFKQLADSVDDYLQQQDAKWGFKFNDEGPVAIHEESPEVRMDGWKPSAEQHAEVMAAEKAPEAFKSLFPTTTFGGASAPKVDADLDKALNQHHEDGTDVQPEGDGTPDAFAAFAHAQLTSRPQPTSTVPAARANPDRPVEKNREEANGVKRPSTGTLCAQVWDIATQLSNGDEKPSTKVAKLSEVVKAATDKGINQYTARTQYARWRVFHGIVGRNA